MPIWGRHHLFLLVAFLLIRQIALLFVASPEAQGPTAAEREKLLEESAKAAEQYIAVVRPQAFRNLTGKEREIYEQITFKVTKDDSAWESSSFIDKDGERVVEIDVGYVRSIEMMVDAFLLEELRNQEFLADYIRYVASQLSQKATFIKSPYEFLGMSDTEMDKFFEEKGLQRQRVAAVANTIAFVLAHEVGHHVLGHTDDRPEARQAKLAAEREADAWAVQQLVSVHFPPLAGVVPLLFDFYFEPLGSPDQGTHPTSIERVHALFQAMRDAAPQFRTDVEAQGRSYANFKRGLDEKLTELESQMKAASALETAETSSANPFCSAVQKVVSQAETRFRRLAGSPEPGGESFEAPVLLPGAKSCRVWQYRDRSLGSAVVCEYGRSPSREEVDQAFDRLAALLETCLTGWTSRSFEGVRQRTLSFTGPKETNVRLRRDESRRRGDYFVSIWFSTD